MSWHLGKCRGLEEVSRVTFPENEILELGMVSGAEKKSWEPGLTSRVMSRKEIAEGEGGGGDRREFWRKDKEPERREKEALAFHTAAELMRVTSLEKLVKAL